MHSLIRRGFPGMFRLPAWGLALPALLALVAGPLLPLRAEVVIHELMFHPASELDRDEWLELYNTGSEEIDLSGWRFTTGVRFTFPSPTRLEPGGYLVLAANTAAFAQLHPAVTNVVGNWNGILSNSGQEIELVDAAGRRVDRVRYADDGDWGERRRGPIDYGHRGWEWDSGADGEGASLELVQPRLDHDAGQNWAPSTIPGGTPGRPNSVGQTNTAPLILDVVHRPLLPRSTEPVTITARLVDEAAGPTAVLHYRRDGTTNWVDVPLVDDGLHGDLLAKDGVFTAVIPPQPDGTVIAFQLSATDSAGLTRSWPAPARVDGQIAPPPPALYLVDDQAPPSPSRPGDLPLYRIILSAADRAELEQINRNSPAPPYATSDQTRSHAEFNATFISQDGTGSSLRYLVGVRNRGNGSRSRQPQSLRVNFRNDHRWKDAVALNLNSQYTPLQLLGSALYRRAGLGAAASAPALVRLHQSNLSTTGQPAYGFHVANEVLNSDYASRTFPEDSSGNLYRGIRLERTGASLAWEGEDPAPYRDNYFKQTNTSQDDWSDLIALCRTLNLTPDTGYADAIRAAVDVDQWMTYFAVETLVVNRETNLANGNNGSGQGDDYFLYFGQTDPRARLLPYDLDTILGQGDSTADPRESLFRMHAVPAIARFMKHPDFAPLYYRKLLALLGDAFAASTFDQLVDQILGDRVDATYRGELKDFMARRRLGVLEQIPSRLTATNSTLSQLNGAYQTRLESITLHGVAPAAETRSVRVGGQPASWSAWDARWTNAAVALLPGLNRILVQAFDADGREIDRTTVDVDVARDSATGVPGGSLAADALWKAAEGPFQVNGTVTVGPGRTLTIEPGTTVFFAPGSGLVATGGGRILAEGTDLHHIRLAGSTTSTATWGGLLIQGGGTNVSRLSWVDFDRAGSGGYNLRVENSTIHLAHTTFSGTTAQYVDLHNSSFLIEYCVFPDLAGLELIHASGLPPTGYGIFRGNWFGRSSGYNDIIDFTGGNRPDAIVQFLDNVFHGAPDDCFDMDGTDAHIEGNVFLRVRQDAARASSSNPITTGADSGNTSELVIVRNIFAESDHALLLKDGGSAVFHHNTVVRLLDNPLASEPPGLISFFEHRSGVTPGGTADLDGNILWDLGPRPLAVNFTNGPSRFILRRSIAPTNGLAGLEVSDVIHEDPRFGSLPDGLTAEELRAGVRLRPGSPALGAGAGGLDLGALVPAGVHLSGNPTGTTWRTNLTLTAAGPGLTAYRWRLNDGPWSTEVPLAAPLILTNLTNGTYRVQAIGRNSAGAWQAEAGAFSTPTWQVKTDFRQVRLHEVLARSRRNEPDRIELHNDSPEPADLGGWSLTDTPASPRRYVFPAGTTLPADGLLVVVADEDPGTGGLRTGFGLDAQGETLELRRTDGSLADTVTFGPQIPDLSVGRQPDGTWVLCSPTFGSPNRPARTGDAATLRINEWLAASDRLFPGDYLELFNPDPLPVALGGLQLTDNPVGRPRAHIIAPLSFIEGRGYTVFAADAHPDQGADHLRFKLASEGGVLQLALEDSTGRHSIDTVFYPPQFADQAQGRSPSGADTLAWLVTPTPGSPNPGSSTGPGTEVSRVVVPLVGFTNRWHFWQTNDPGPGWRDPGFTDTPWPESGAPFQIGSATLPLPRQTTLTLGRITYYFRTRFTLPALPAPATLQLQTLIDDGAVFWLNGQLLHSENMPADVPTDATRAVTRIDTAQLAGPTLLSKAALQPGENVLAVEVHQQSSSSQDLAFALRLWAEYTVTNSVSATNGTLVLNEVLARNGTLAEPTGLVLDWVELFNPTDSPADLSGALLTDVPDRSRGLVLPEGFSVPPRGFLRLYFDRHPLPQVSLPGDPPVATVPARLTASFGLSAAGDSLYLFDRPDRGGALLDSVSFGPQVPDLSLSRLPDGSGTWRLTRPTPDLPNDGLVELGDPARVRVNEWMANPPPGSDDWFELYNPEPRPVDLSGWYVTDDPAGAPTRHRLPPHTYLGTNTSAFLRLVADAPATDTPGHVNFRLSGSGEALGLASPEGAVVEAVSFGRQTEGVSEGRYPDGATGVLRFATLPSPGAANEADADADGLADAWELAQGLSPANPQDAALDPDGDGRTNRAEFLAGTDPRNPLSVLSLTLRGTSSDGAAFSFLARAHHRYWVEMADTIPTTTWIRLMEIPPVASDRVIQAGDLHVPGSARYYRLQVLPEPF